MIVVARDDSVLARGDVSRERPIVAQCWTRYSSNNWEEATCEGASSLQEDRQDDECLMQDTVKSIRSCREMKIPLV